ncbi:A24 family peptidase [Lachnospiraceae bacterium ZAX-1]
MDVKTGRISNRLICFGLSSGCLIQIYDLGMKGIFIFLLNVSLPVIFLFLLFQMHALGAGDIKLFSVIGSIFNLKVTVWCILASFVVGAVFAICKLIYNQNLMARLLYFCGYMQDFLETKVLKKYDGQSDGKQNYIHFSIPILIGYLIMLEVVY